MKDTEKLRNLAVQAASGDLDAAEELFRTLHGYLASFLFLQGIPRSDIEDVAQQAAIEVYRYLPRYDSKRPFLPWMRTIAARTAGKHWRSHARRHARIDRFREHVRTKLGQWSRAGHLHDLPVEELEQCLGRLPQKQRELLQLRYRQELNAEQIAERLSRTSVAVRKALSRIREALRVCIDTGTVAVTQES